MLLRNQHKNENYLPLIFFPIFTLCAITVRRKHYSFFRFLPFISIIPFPTSSDSLNRVKYKWGSTRYDNSLFKSECIILPAELSSSPCNIWLKLWQNELSSLLLWYLTFHERVEKFSYFWIKWYMFASGCALAKEYGKKGKSRKNSLL